MPLSTLAGVTTLLYIIPRKLEVNMCKYGYEQAIKLERAIHETDLPWGGMINNLFTSKKKLFL